MHSSTLLRVLGTSLSVASAALAQAAPAREDGSEPDSTVSTPATASSQPPTGRFFLGLRTGLGLPMGDVMQDDPMSDTSKGQIPIGLDLGYMLSQHFMLGLYGQYGFGLVSSELSDNCTDCSLSHVRFGLQGQYHVAPAENINPWVGLGVGYEVMTLSNSSGESATIRGFEYVNLQGGLDFKVAPAFALGPYVNLSFARYDTVSTSDDAAGSQKTDVPSDRQTMHEWLTIGVRGAFKL